MKLDGRPVEQMSHPEKVELTEEVVASARRLIEALPEDAAIAMTTLAMVVSDVVMSLNVDPDFFFDTVENMMEDIAERSHRIHGPHPHDCRCHEDPAAPANRDDGRDYFSLDFNAEQHPHEYVGTVIVKARTFTAAVERVRTLGLYPGTASVKGMAVPTDHPPLPSIVDVFFPTKEEANKAHVDWRASAGDTEDPASS